MHDLFFDNNIFISWLNEVEYHWDHWSSWPLLKREFYHLDGLTGQYPLCIRTMLAK